MSDEMPRISFLWDSIMEHGELQKFWTLIRIATDSTCEFRYLGWESPEGYVIHRYVISASAPEGWKRFSENVARVFANSDWSPLSDEEFVRLFSYKGRLT